MRFDAVIFDLDGTLVNTLDDIAAAGNHMLRTIGKNELPVNDFRQFIGHGAQWFVKQLLADTHPNQIDPALKIYRDYYDARGLTHSHRYTGIDNLLTNLTTHNIKLAICSNKPHPSVQQVVQALLTTWPFAAAIGSKPGQPLKPDPAPVLKLAAQLDTPLPRCLYIGDMPVDMQTARAAGTFALGAAWGFCDGPTLRNAGADHVIEHPREVLALLNDE